MVPLAYAASIPLLDKITTTILNPLITLLFAFALVYFLYGVYEMVRGSDNEEARRIGQQHVLWGVIGMAIMISAFGIMHVVCNTIGC